MDPLLPPSATIASLVASVDGGRTDGLHEDLPRRSQRDITVAAHAHQFRKVLELSDVVIQVGLPLILYI